MACLALSVALVLGAIDTTYCFDEVVLDCCGCPEVMGSYVQMELVREEVWAWDVGEDGCLDEPSGLYYDCVVGYTDAGWVQTAVPDGLCLDLLDIGPGTLHPGQHVWSQIVAVDAAGNRSDEPCPPCPENCQPLEAP